MGNKVGQPRATRIVFPQYNMRIFLRNISFIVLIVLSLGVGGCCTADGLVKTELNNRKHFEYPSLGISMELPKQSWNFCAGYPLNIYDGSTFEINSHVKSQLVAFMHPVWFGNPLVEPDYLLVIKISRLTPKEFDGFLNGDPYLFGGYGDKQEPFRKDLVQYETKEKHGNRQYLVFRKDIKLSDGDIVIAGAELRNNVNFPYFNREEDIKAIMEILNSVKPLQEK